MDSIRETAESVLKKIGLASDSIVYAPLPGGRNNRVWQLETSAGPVLLKQYFRDGGWDRLAAESRFLRFCEQMRIGRVPLLLAEDPGHGLAIHSWLDGEPVPATGFDAGDIDEAAAFAHELTEAWWNAAIPDAPPARDACLRPMDFFRSLRKRLRQLEEALEANSEAPCFADALAFYRDVLHPEWELARNGAEAMLARRDPRRPFSAATLLLSPSDFGFHNALRLRSGGLGFVDFEYAGLDSSIKLLGDFLCQADFPVPAGSAERLATALSRNADEAVELVAAVETLLPLFRVKFCCIVLNDFKSADACRRGFAGFEPFSARLAEQLAKARTMVRNDRKTGNADWV